ncbi:Piso0_000312 [Millerozyma farinosa CBS 7064]|uniref:Piso0_000312 protein n=1 Tax=Pichia sorbitophila (strain ATCC MYA-4447 / BCRC 22081 / CBS 7064 / NBRC 10061 / NRRL Y-12695) TaxID=559304 RepID=G8YV37_PICSO|nr:Piso0_000312 [Millerozyma farinosa CBS 7064]
MEKMKDSSRISYIFSGRPQFSFFEELISLPEDGTSVSSHDFIKINKLVEDICLYLGSLNSLFKELKVAEEQHAKQLGWYYEGRDQIQNLSQNMENIDSIISRILALIETSKRLHEHESTLSQIERASDMLLEVKKHIIVLKKKVDIAVIYEELNETIMASLLREIEDCIKWYMRISEIKMSSPTKHLPKFNMEQVIAKMRINDVTKSTFTTKSIQPPTFNEVDEAFYKDFLSLKERLTPINVSLQYLPIKIEEFKFVCQSLGPNVFLKDSINDTQLRQKRLFERWTYLQSKMGELKTDVIDTKLNQVFSYLMHEISSKCDTLSRDLQDNDSTVNIDEIGATYKICCNSITLLSKAFLEETITDGALANYFNDTLLSKWQAVSDLLADVGNPSDSNTITKSGNGRRDATMRSYNIKPFVTEIKQPKKSNNSLGIDLGLGVASSKVPYSIEKKDRVKNVLREKHDNSTKRSLKDALVSISSSNDNDNDNDNEENLMRKKTNRHSLMTNVSTETMFTKDDDEVTLVSNKTPNIPISSCMSPIKEPLEVKDIFEVKELRESLPCEDDQTKNSKIPIINKNYIELGLPVIPKRLQPECGRSKIPVLKPKLGYEENSFLKSNNVKSLQPAVHIPYNEPKGRWQPSPTPVREQISSTPKILTKVRRPARAVSAKSLEYSRQTSVPTLDLLRTPSLTLPTSPAYRSTSPDRPSSSVDSRFDEKHLVQPIKSRKPSWK